MDREAKSSMLRIGKILTGIVYAIFIVYIVILTLAFFLRLFGANPAADFAEWVYNAAARIMEPFRGIFPTTQISDTAGVRRVAALRHHRVLDPGAGGAVADRLVRRPAHGAPARSRARPVLRPVEAAQAAATVPGQPTPGATPSGHCRVGPSPALNAARRVYAFP